MSENRMSKRLYRCDPDGRRNKREYSLLGYSAVLHNVHVYDRNDTLILITSVPRLLRGHRACWKLSERNKMFGCRLNSSGCHILRQQLHTQPSKYYFINKGPAPRSWKRLTIRSSVASTYTTCCKNDQWLL